MNNTDQWGFNVTELIADARQRGGRDCVCGSGDDQWMQCQHHRERAIQDIRRLADALELAEAERVKYRDLWSQRSDDADALTKANRIMCPKHPITGVPTRIEQKAGQHINFSFSCGCFGQAISVDTE